MAKKKTFKRTELSHVVKSIKPGSNLLAQNANLCDTGIDQTSDLYAWCMSFVFDVRLPIEIRLLIDLILSSGCRISELLNNDGVIVRKNGMIEVYQSKTKKKIVFRSANYNSYFMQYAGNRYRGFNIYSRFQIYRLFKKLGFSVLFDGNSKASVCHLPRHLNALLTYESTNDINDVKTALNHSNSKTSLSYVKKIK